MSTLRRIALVTRTLMRGRSILLAFLMLWPSVLSGILLVAEHGRPAREDVAAILQQELLYGLVLVGLGASVALGTELRAHRVVGVLGRAVGRGEYLAALALSALLPFLGYVAVLALNGAVFASLLGAALPAFGLRIAAELQAGVVTCAAGVMFSVWLPQVAAGVATGLVLAGLAAAGQQGAGGLAALFAAVTGGAFRGSLTVAALWMLAATASLLLLAVVLFRRKDVRV